MRLLFLLVVYFSSYVVSEENELSEFDRKNCFKSYLSRSYRNDKIIELDSYIGLIEECNNIVKAETEKFDNNLLTIIEAEPKVENCTYCKECMMKFIKDFNVSDVALKDKTYDNSKEIILNKDITNLLLRISYFYCYPDDLLRIKFETDFQFEHWRKFSLKVIKKEICLLMDAIQVFDLNTDALPKCESVFSQIFGPSPFQPISAVDQLLLIFFEQDNNQDDQTQSLAIIKSCLMTKFQEKGYIDNTTYYSKIERSNCDQVYNPIKKAAKISFQLPMMLVAKLAQCFLYDILDEDFLYESLFHFTQTKNIREEEMGNAEEKLIKFVKKTLQNYVNCLVHVEWKIETVLVLYKYMSKMMMKKMSDHLSNKN